MWPDRTYGLICFEPAQYPRISSVVIEELGHDKAQTRRIIEGSQHLPAIQALVKPGCFEVIEAARPTGCDHCWYSKLCSGAGFDATGIGHRNKMLVELRA
jgi:hypothetical protein